MFPLAGASCRFTASHPAAQFWTDLCCSVNIRAVRCVVLVRPAPATSAIWRQGGSHRL